ncbi:MAG: glycosyltransferase [Bacteroidota bacterium]
MKYWLLTSEFPPLYGGGIATYCFETAKMLTQNNHEVTIFTHDYQVKTFSIELNDKFRIVKFNPNQYFTETFLGFETNLSYAFAQIIEEFIKKKDAPDIIESQEYMGIAYYLLQFKYLEYPIFKNLKIVLTLHAPSFLYLEYNKINTFEFPYFWIGEMEKFCIKAADLLISPSQYLVNEIQARIDISEKTVHIIKNPFQFEKKPIENYENGKIVFFGKLTPQKGCLELINNFKKLWNEGFEYSLTMIGGGNHLYHVEGIDMIDFIKSKYKKEIDEKKLILVGSIPPTEHNKHIDNAHIIVIPSLVENFPYTVLETMCKGKIVLASVQGGHAEIINNYENGFLFDHEQKDSFNKQLKQILSLDQVTTNNLSINAINKVIEECSYEIIFNKKLGLINSFLIENKKTNTFPFLRPVNSFEIENDDNSEKGLLSVVVPYFNMGEFVNETISSILNSTYKNIEIIIVDDGSNDKLSIEKINEFENKKSIKIIRKENKGLPMARNDGAKAAKGEFLAFLDPDDTVESSYYEKAIAVLKSYNNVHFIGCWAKYFGSAKGYWPTFNPEPPYLLVHNMINSSALIYKKQAFLAAGLNDKKMIFGMEDYESVISMKSKGFNGVVLPETLWNYRVRKDSMARAFTKNKQLYLYRLISEKHKDYFSLFSSDISNLLNTNGSGLNYDNPTLLTNFIENNFLKKILNQKLVRKIKTIPLLRRIAITIKNSNRFRKNKPLWIENP